MKADGVRESQKGIGAARVKNGQPYNNHYAQVFRVRDGMVVEWIEYLDTAMLARILGE